MEMPALVTGKEGRPKVSTAGSGQFGTPWLRMAVARDRHIQIAGDREQRDPVPGRLDPDEDDRVGAGAVEARPAVVGTDDEDRLRLRLRRKLDERM